MEAEYFNKLIDNFSRVNKINNRVYKIKQMIIAGQITKFDLAEKLGISRVTLDSRLIKDNWKKGELALLKNIA